MEFLLFSLLQMMNVSWFIGLSRCLHLACWLAAVATVIASCSDDGEDYDWTDTGLLEQTGVPLLSIDTEGTAPVTSKTEYLPATSSLSVPGQVTDLAFGTQSVAFPRMAESFADVPLRIRGRGNSTWKADKKPYRIKFDEKRSMLGMRADKDWVLLANWYDRSALHTFTAYFLGAASGLDWTPSGDFVELVLNGEYQGLYFLSERVEASSGRLPLATDGFLLEIDQPKRVEDDDVAFRTDRLNFVIKWPETTYGSADYERIKGRVSLFERTLFSDHWLDTETGYAALIDMESFADWYLINEITKNSDANFFSSCYLHTGLCGELMMGPIWDFDLSLGSTHHLKCRGAEGFWVRQAVWLSRMWDDPAFVAVVRARFDHFKAVMPELYARLDDERDYLLAAAQQDNRRWNTFFRQCSYMPINGSFKAEVQAVKDFLQQRMAWLDAQIPM